ncbi:uncharacterized protein LOC116203353 [Punica granatum]|uniref:Uncharacterized protein LOC116203353 n=1 Tax=Punica granatum TaxID=22663 RepID=A0A218XKD2_PUNGR|nr:uncharacterized protein LOC116203353 [Punica granatum]OWM85278.1 hypothetical protein CDL15_Pgr028065 [Punica granatum]
MAKDTESFQSQEEKRQKRMKLAAYIGAFAVFQVIVILVFALVVMKVKTPKFRIGNGIEIQSLTAGTQSSPSFDMSFIAPIRIKNTNFGPYKYDATTVNFTYGGVQVGQVAIPKSKANFKSTKKVDVIVSVNSDALTSTSGLGSELNSGLLTLNSQGRMNGKVELMLIFKKKKSTNMNCTMAINVSTKAVQSVSCE